MRDLQNLTKEYTAIRATTRCTAQEQEIMSIIKNYLRQASTYKGIAALAATAGVTIPAMAIQPASSVVIGLLGLWEVFRNEKKNDQK